MLNVTTTERSARSPYKARQRKTPLPNRVQAFRSEASKTLAACALHVGVTPQAIHRYEKIGKGLGTEHLILLSEFLGADLKAMISAPDPP